MTFNFTVWDIAPIAAYYALVHAGPVLLAAAVAILALSALRRRTWLRRTAYALLSVVVVLAVAAIPFLSWQWDELRRQRAFEARTHHLTAPQSFGGIAFPAGSTVHLSTDGVPEFGSLPVPATIAGLSVVGTFELDGNGGPDPPGIRGGTLAAPAELHGIPCGPGPLVSQPETTRCTLSRDWAFLGHPLAAGQALEVYRSPLDDPPLLRFGTLARPELLYDVRWPAGTVLGNVHQPPERMAHGPGPESWAIYVCLPSGATADLAGGAVLHGFLGFTVQQDRRLVSPVCSALTDGAVGTDGYAQVGPDRFDGGERPDAGSPWQWTSRFEPSRD